MPAATLRQLLEAGVHFGHQTSRWNPKMRDYIFTSRDRVHIIDLAKTQLMLDEACDYVRELVSGGQKVLFVGTKKQAQDAIVEACARTGQPYVVHRWMGGMLTNFAVIQRQLKRLIELRSMNERGDFERMSGKESNENRDASGAAGAQLRRDGRDEAAARCPLRDRLQEGAAGGHRGQQAAASRSSRWSTPTATRT